MSGQLFKTALRDAGKLYFLMVLSGMTSITIVGAIALSVVYTVPSSGQLVAKLGTKQELLQWHQREAELLKKDLQQK